MIVCGGENLMDVIEQPGAQMPRSFTAHPGGSPYNCSRAIGRLGGAVGYLGTLSTDRFGTQLLGTLHTDNVAHLGTRSDAPTTLAMVTLQDGLPDYRFYRSDTADRHVTLESLRAALPAQTQALHLSSIALVEGADAQAWQGLFADAAAAGIVTTLDPNVRLLLADAHEAEYRVRLNAMAKQASLIRLSDEDAAWWFPDLTPFDALQALRQTAPKAVLILTQGPRPVLCACADENFTYPPDLPPTLADTVGAGDTLMAAVLVGLARKDMLSRAALQGLQAATLRDVIANATRAAAITCGRDGCNPPHARELWP